MNKIFAAILALVGALFVGSSAIASGYTPRMLDFSLAAQTGPTSLPGTSYEQGGGGRLVQYDYSLHDLAVLDLTGGHLTVSGNADVLINCCVTSEATYLRNIMFDFNPLSDGTLLVYEGSALHGSYDFLGGSGFQNLDLTALGPQLGLRLHYSGSYQLDNVHFESFGAVPEPATWAMMIIGFGLLGTAMRREGRRLAKLAQSIDA